jgi:TRAP-type C4-dicarboxylate transport system permease small subunit
LALAIASVALLGLVLVQAWQVFARYALNASPSWTEPMTVLLLSTTMSFGAAAGVQRARHFAFGLLADALPARARRVLSVVRELIVAGVGMGLALGAALLCADGWAISVAGAPLPQSAPYLPLALGGALMALFGLARVVHAWRGDA